MLWERFVNPHPFSGLDQEQIPAGRKIVLHVTRSREDGSWSRYWDVPRDLQPDPWFLFGRCGGGWSPFPTSNLGKPEEMEYCAQRARERYGLPVYVIRKA